MNNKLITIILLNIGLFLITPLSILAEEETLFLPADCSTYGIWDAGNQTCTLTQDLTKAVEITADNITLDCNGHSITGPGSGRGIYLNTRQGVIIKKCLVNNFNLGIDLFDSSNNQITESDIFNNNFFGFSLMCSSNNIIAENSIFENGEIGLYLACLIPTSNNLIYHNNFINNEEQIVDEDYPNSFDNGYPAGGNYYDDYAGIDLYSGPDQEEPGPDGIGDTPYVFAGGQDNYPFMEESGWTVPVNQPPTFFNLNQYKSDIQTEIVEGGITTESTVVFKATVSDPDNDQVKLQIELKEFNQSFNETSLVESGFVLSGQQAQITRYGLVEGQYHWRARAADARGAVSDWQEFGTAGNVDFEVKLVPLYTQIISPYPSIEETDLWDDLRYGTGNYPECRDSQLGYSAIRSCGCAITSEVMILRFHGVTTDVDGNDVNPQTFNEWLTNNSGYWPDGGAKWEKIQEYSRDEFGFARVVYDGPVNYKDNATLDLYLNGLLPVILYQKVLVQGESTSHFIVADGKLATTHTIKDPAWYNTKYLTQAVDSYVQNYNNYFYGLRLFHPTLALRGVDSISLNLASPAELLVTDPQGRKLGKDPINDIEYNEIPGGSYYLEGIGNPFPEIPAPTKESKFIWIPDPLEGEYNIQIIGTELGEYTLDFLAYNEAGESTSATLKGVTDAEVTSNYSVNYTSIPGEITEIERVVTIEDAVGDVEMSYELGWITKKFVKDILIVKLKVAQLLEEQKEKQLEHFDKLIEKAKNPIVRQELEKAKEEYEKRMNKVITRTLELFIKEVRFYTNKGYITEKALELLIEDAQYIIEHL